MNMHLRDMHDDTESTFRTQSIFLITLMSLVVLILCVFNNFAHGHHLIGIGALVVLTTAAISSWQAHRGYHRPRLIACVLSPGLITLLYLELQNQGVMATYWIYPAIVAYYYMLDIKRAQVLNLLTLLVLCPSIWVQLEPAVAMRVLSTLLAVSIFSAISAINANKYQRALTSKAVTDPLTGLLNRTLLNDTLDAAIEQHQREATPMTLLIMDLDNFKSVNDTDGHEAGDRVLAGIAEIVKKSTRISDSCFRLGGEELLCLLYGANYSNGCRIAERIRAQVECADFSTTGPTTTSIGVSTIVDGDTSKRWVARADRKLYEAKSAGKNRVA